ncbi:MAG: 4-hydroxybenzoate octaprenyltransferase [Phycisphaerae bacterium]
MRRRLARELLEFGRTIRFFHTLFALPFALGAAFLAEPPCPRPWALALLVACMVTARTAAMGMNRVADARLDARNPRTAEWPIPAGRLRRGTALALALVSGGAFLACVWGFWFLSGNLWPGLLAPGFLALLLFYPYTKRFTVLSHWILGACLGLAPVGAWIALRGSLVWTPLVLGLAVVFWTAGFDILYAIRDIAFDRREGLRSVPARFGRATALRTALECHVLAWLLLGGVIGMDVFEKVLMSDGEVRAGVLGRWSSWALGLVAILILIQHLAVRRARGDGVTAAVFHLNALVGIVWMAGVILDSGLG